LLHILVSLDVGSVDSNDLSDSLNDRQVLEFSGKHHEGAVLNNSVLVDWLVGVSNLQRADKTVRLVGLVGKASVKDDGIEVEEVLLTILVAVLQFGVLVLTSFLRSLNLSLEFFIII
jgi:hypothetical protein